MYSGIKVKKQVLRCLQAKEVSVNVLIAEIFERIVKQLNFKLFFFCILNKVYCKYNYFVTSLQLLCYPPYWILIALMLP